MTDIDGLHLPEINHFDRIEGLLRDIGEELATQTMVMLSREAALSGIPSADVPAKAADLYLNYRARIKAVLERGQGA